MLLGTFSVPLVSLSKGFRLGTVLMAFVLIMPNRCCNRGIKGEEGGFFMVMTNSALAGFPELPVVEPVSGAQIQFWASFAAQSTTKPAFHIVSRVFYAFWMETAGYEDYQQVCRDVEVYWVSSAIGWLDLMVSALDDALSCWREVITIIDQDQSLQSWAAAWYTNAADRVQALSRLCHQVVEGIVSYCRQVGWEVPKYTQKYLASHQ
jgi:hypothetical protein